MNATANRQIRYDAHEAPRATAGGAAVPALVALYDALTETEQRTVREIILARRGELDGREDGPAPLPDVEEAAAQLISVEDAASVIGLTTRAVAKMCQEGRLRAVKVGRRWRINRAALYRMVGVESPSGPVPGATDGPLALTGGGQHA